MKSNGYVMWDRRMCPISIAISETLKSSKSAGYWLPLLLSSLPTPMLAATFSLPYIRNAIRDHGSRAMTN